MDEVAHVEALRWAQTEIDLPRRPPEVIPREVRRRSERQKGGLGGLAGGERDLLERNGTADDDEGVGTGPSGINAAAESEVVEQGAPLEDIVPALVEASSSV
jgi:hypothetical protein